MDNYLAAAADYFRPPEKYFWRWAEEGNVIEWRDGDTICYKEELVTILRQISTEGLPSLGAVLLVLSACKDNWRSSAKNNLLLGVVDLIKWYETLDIPGLDNELNYVHQLLYNIAALPKEHRSKSNRHWLLQAIFKNAEEKIPKDKALNILDAFNSGRIDKYIFKEGLYPAGKYLHADLKNLRKAALEFTSPEVLELAIKTGLQQLPGTPEVEIPPATDLLQQLEQDTKTSGLAQLTRRVIAALNIPMHTHGSSDQLFGGVADITNRGNFDRLLLSELAHDDLSLMARLANNEALYLRREELPSNLQKQRILLIDTTIKMWGIPRVFALSAALACTQNNKEKAHIQSYNLSGAEHTATDLSTKEGIITTLEQLDAALHCGRALSQFMNQPQWQQEDEVFLITEEDTLHNGLFQSIITSLKTPLTYMITVSRNGHLQFYEFLRGRRKLLSEARFDLEELLFHKKQSPVKPKTGVTGVPAIMQQTPFPLYFPASKIKFVPGLFFQAKEKEVVCVTTDQRVLYWTDKNRGARELIHYIENGEYCFGTDGQEVIYILVYAGSTKYTRLYQVNTATNEVGMLTLSSKINDVTEAVFDSGFFYIKTGNGIYSVSAALGNSLPGDSLDHKFNYLQENRNKQNPHLSLGPIKRLVNYGFTVISVVRSVYLNADGEIGFDERHVSFRFNSNMIIIDHNRNEVNKNTRLFKAREAGTPSLPGNARLKCTRFVWADGSEALADSRGFLHLRSSNKNLPEVTIITIMTKPTACWASDGTTSGEDYFAGVPNTKRMDVEGFYYNYIQLFIETIQNHGA